MNPNTTYPPSGPPAYSAPQPAIPQPVAYAQPVAQYQQKSPAPGYQQQQVPSYQTGTGVPGVYGGQPTTTTTVITTGYDQGDGGDVACGFMLGFFLGLIGLLIALLCIYETNYSGRRGAVIGFVVGLIVWTTTIVLV